VDTHGQAVATKAAPSSGLDEEARRQSLAECTTAGHANAPERRDEGRRLLASLILTLGVVGLETAGGLWSGSLALLSDAGHVMTDAVALVLSLATVWITTRPADVKRTFGYYRFEILCALVNGAILLPISGGIAFEAWRRFRSPHEVHPLPMMGIATLGLIINAAMYLLLRRARSMNIRAAMLHVASDALSALGVIVAAGVLFVMGWKWVDPVASVCIAGVIVFGAVRLIRESVNVLLEAVPAHLDLAEVFTAVKGVDGVVEVHDLHIWTLSTRIYALSAHLVVSPAGAVDNDAILSRVQSLLCDRFDIGHSTLQIESQSYAHARSAS
jgi:cobalt-zinc-cadmium efflux system protein